MAVSEGEGIARKAPFLRVLFLGWLFGNLRKATDFSGPIPILMGNDKVARMALACARGKFLDACSNPRVCLGLREGFALLFEGQGVFLTQET